MNPRSDRPQPRIHEQEVQAAATGHPPIDRLVSLNDEQLSLIEVLQREGHGMTARQLELRLSQSRERVELALESLMERDLIVRLNTLVPSYVYRYRGLDLDAE